jgi:uncharacterized membrane protein YbjE (DUF340 family)
MYQVLLLLLVGMLIGFLLRAKKIFAQSVDIIINILIYILLLFLGISMGSNKLIVKNIGSIGINAFVLSLASIVGSVLFCFLVYLLFFRKFENEK